MSFDCVRRQRLDPGVERGRVHPEHRVGAVGQLQAERGRAAERGHGRRRLDQRLARDAVGKHAGAAEAVFIDDGYLGSELGGDECGFVAAWAAAQDRDTWTWQGHVRAIIPDVTHWVVRRPRDYAVRLGSVALYAAYGSNMDPAQMLLRCPHSPQRGTGWLEGWRLTFGGEELGWDGALTTVVEDTAQRMFVALYDVPEVDEKELDIWDGVNLGFYSKIKVRVQTLDGDMLAWLYVLDAYEGGLPSAERLSILVDAAVKAGAPADYIDWLRARPSNPPKGWLEDDGEHQGEHGHEDGRDRGPGPAGGRRRARTSTPSDLTCSARSVRVATTTSASSPSGAGGGASSTGTGDAEAAEADPAAAAGRRAPAAGARISAATCRRREECTAHA